MLIQSRTERQEAIARKRAIVLSWLKAESFSTAPILSEVLGFGKAGTHKTLHDMRRAELVDVHLVPAGAGELQIWGLTPHGSGMAVDPDDADPDWSYFEPGRVSPLTIGHALDVQRVRLALTRDGWTEWCSDRDCHKLNLPKIPDALARDPSGQVVAIEVERTLKTQKRYRDIAAIYLQMARAGAVDRVQYVCPMPGMAQRIARLYSGLEYVVVKGQRIDLRMEHHERFTFIDFSTRKGAQ